MTSPVCSRRRRFAARWQVPVNGLPPSLLHGYSTEQRGTFVKRRSMALQGWPGPSLGVLCLTALALGATPAEAHLVTTGLGPIYDGISHFAMSPEDLFPAFALALLGGQCGVETSRRVLFVLPGAWLLGGFAGLAAGAPIIPDLTWLSLVILGALIAGNLRPSAAVVTGLALVLGAFHGFLNGSTMSSASEGLRALLGIVGSVFVMAALITAGVVISRWQPLRIGIRVLGSWTAATGILLLGWSLH
jgi:urease accessory protein